MGSCPSIVQTSAKRYRLLRCTPLSRQKIGLFIDLNAVIQQGLRAAGTVVRHPTGRTSRARQGGEGEIQN
jgi:hypothetical protein